MRKIIGTILLALAVVPYALVVPLRWIGNKLIHGAGRIMPPK